MSRSVRRKAEEEATFRFAIVSSDGRRSREWRLWTYAGGEASDEVYLAPRDSGDSLKLSLHASGHGQLGLGLSTREKLLSIDRRALDRWLDPGIVSGVRFAYCVDFPESELRDLGPIQQKTVALEAPPRGFSVQLQIAIVDDQEKLDFLYDRATPLGLEIVASLPRKTGGEVLVLKAVEPSSVEMVLYAKNLCANPWKTWELPGNMTSNQNFGIFLDVERATKQRFAVEIAIDSDMGRVKEPLVFEGFRGTLKEWKELPLTRAPEACAVLRLESDGIEFIYVNSHSRCQHERLFIAAHGILDNFIVEGPDDRWNKTLDGGCFTIMSPPELLFRQSASNPRILEQLNRGLASRPFIEGNTLEEIGEHFRENHLPEPMLIVGSKVLYSRREADGDKITVGFRP